MAMPGGDKASWPCIRLRRSLFPLSRLMDIVHISLLVITGVVLAIIVLLVRGGYLVRHQISIDQPVHSSDVSEAPSSFEQNNPITLPESAGVEEGNKCDSGSMDWGDGLCIEEYDILAGNGESNDAEGYEELESSPIPLLEEDEVDGKLQFRQENLKKLLDSDILKDKPVAIVSIAGALRMGKSFLLNLLLRYLKKEGWNSKNEEWLRNWNFAEDSGIRWRGGSTPHTRGIVAWGKPILIKGYQKTESQIAVILLDTQGNFEHGRSMEENARVFALSTLFSSLQIFNVSKQIQTNDLDYLQCFVEFAKTAKPSQKNEQSNVDSGDSEEYKGQFQDLAYLVRDWPHPDDFKHGEEGGMKYLENFMSIRKGTKSQNEVQKYLAKTFHELTCFLMPEPGETVRISKNNDRAMQYEDLGHDFAYYLTLFANKYLHPHLIQTKKIGHTQCTNVDDLRWYMEACASALTGTDVVNIPNLMTLVAEYACTMAMIQGEESFVTNVTQQIERMDQPSWESFESILQEEQKSTMSDFYRKSHYGKDSRDVDAWSRLETQLRLRKSELTTAMQRKRARMFEEVISIWLEESAQMLQNQRGYFLTEIDGFDKIKEDRLKLLMKKHRNDSSDVSKVLQVAKEKLDAMTNEAIRRTEDDNSQKKWYTFKVLGTGVAAGVTTAAAAVAVGAVATVAAPVIVAAPIVPCAILVKKKLDNWWNSFFKKKKND